MWSSVQKYFAEFKVLKNTPREFWTLNLVINFFEMLAYFSFITVLTLYLTDNIGFDDEWAGNVMGMFTMLITVIIFFSGFIIDSIGVKKALFISMVMLIPCRILMGITGPIENQYLEKNLNLAEARVQIEEQELHKKAFTTDKKRMVAAQVDLITAEPTFAELGIKAETLSEDGAKLREEILKIAKKSVFAQKTHGDKLEENIQDGDVFKELIVAMVGEKPDIAAKYYVDLAKLESDPAKYKAEIISIVKAYPELRAKHSIQDMLKYFIFVLLFFTAFGEALMVPGIYAALRGYVNKKTSGAGFNFQYLTMNIGAVLSFILFDFLRQNFGNESIFIFGGFMAVICAVAVLTLRPNIEVLEDGTIVEKEEVKKEDRETPVSIFMSVVKEAAFWRFMMFIGLLIGVRLTFTHQFMVMPKYYDRVLGLDAPIGLLNSINPTLICLGLIMFIPILGRFKVFSLILVGTVISALSVFVLVIPAKLVMPFGFSLEEAFLVLIIAQIVIFALGELIWSPRLSEYTVTIAPKGREGSYMSMQTLPMFIAKPLNGWISGVLLMKFCPEGVSNDIISGARNFWNGPEFMWLIFGVIAISSPILIILLRNVINPDKEEEEEEVPEPLPEEA